MQTTAISWCDYSWNPVTGCSHAGPICVDPETGESKCWAERFSRRQGRTDAKWTAENAEANVQTHEERLDEPFEYSYPEGPGKVFVVSMGDLLHPLVPDSFVRQVVTVAYQLPEHVWIFLTKRPHRLHDLDVVWPDNAWVGTSVGSAGNEYPDTTGRIEQLREIDATTWVSFEPLLDPIGDVDLSHVDWIVVGGESDPSDESRREMEHAWARDLLRQAREQDVPFHFKQSSGSSAETGTQLTVEREFGDSVVYEQRTIREEPPLPEITREARSEVSTE